MRAKKTRPVQETDWTLLEVLWKRGRASAREVADALDDERGWAYSTVKTLLDRMVVKRLVEAARVDGVWHYTAAIGLEEARRTAWRRFVDVVFAGSTEPALRFIASDARLTERQRQALLELLNREDVHE